MKGKKKIIIVDYGVKNNIIRAFLKRNITVIRCPWNYNFLEKKADGIVLSNGPGNPKMCKPTIEYLKHAIKQNKPIFGICLGHQLINLAAKANTYKLKFGHRSQNQPCLQNNTNKCYITSQNHGYAVDVKSISNDWAPLFTNINDNSNEGIIHKTKPIFTVQFHPESYPGPNDTEFLFDRFIDSSASTSSFGCFPATKILRI